MSFRQAVLAIMLLVFSTISWAHEVCPYPPKDVLNRVIRLPSIGLDESTSGSAVVLGGSLLVSISHVAESVLDQDLYVPTFYKGHAKARAVAIGNVHGVPGQHKKDPLVLLQLTREKGSKVLPINVPELPIVTVAELVPGERVWAVGWGLGIPLRITTQGRYMGLFNTYNLATIAPDYLLPTNGATTAPVDKGMSGGAVFVCREGKYALAGVLSSVPTSPTQIYRIDGIRQPLVAMVAANTLSLFVYLPTWDQINGLLLDRK